MLLAALLATLAWTSEAEATVTLGQLPQISDTPQNCGGSSGAFLQASVTSGNSYVAPTAGKIRSWSTRAVATSGQQVSLFIFRPLGGSTYQTVSHDGPHPLTASTVNTFQVNLAVKAGDVLGLNPDLATSFPTECGFVVPGETGEFTTFPSGPPADGQSGTVNPNPGKRVDVSAELDPSNDFGFAGLTKNKKKGQATVTVNLPGSGSATLMGQGVKAQSAAFGTPSGGTLPLKVVPTKKLAKKLKGGGKAGVTVDVTFTPSGGSALTKSEGLKLVKKKG